MSTITIEEFIKVITNQHFNNIHDAVDFVRNTMSNIGLVTRNSINTCCHRHYSTSQRYFMCADGLVGIEGVDKVFAEECSFEDVDVECTIFIGESYISYRPNKRN